jgi:hypothetical protein
MSVRLDERSLRYICRQVAKNAGIERSIHPHLFRHACATHMLDAGADLRTIQVMLGHPNHGSVPARLHAAITGDSKPFRFACIEAYRSDGRRSSPAMSEHRLEVADVFRQHRKEFFAHWGHTLLPQQRKVFRDIS